MTKMIIGIMGPGDNARPEDEAAAYQLGALAAERGYVVLSGGRSAGVMDAASRGAKEAGGLSVGVLPGEDSSGMSQHLDIAIFTGLGSARNNINVLSSSVVVAIGTGAGTASEAALALKAGKHVVLLGCGEKAEAFFRSLAPDRVHCVSTSKQAIEKADALLAAGSSRKS